MSKTRSEISTGLVVALLVMQIALGLLLSQAYFTSHNTLYNNGNWKVTKTELWNGLIGSYGFLFDLQPLARGYMNVGAWHGCQEVVLKEALDPVSVEFDFYLHSPTSYVNFFFNRSEKKYTAIRLSRHKDFPGAILNVSDEGLFLRKRPLKILRRLSVRSWHQFKLEFDGDWVTAFLNGKEIKRFKSKNVSPQYIGFRGGLRPAHIDNLRILSRDGSEFRDDFDRPRNWRVVALAMVVGVCLLAWGCFLVLRKISSLGDRRLLFFFLMISGVLLVVSGALLVLVSQRTGFYPNESKKLKLREAYWKDATAEALYARIEEDFPREPDPNTHRVFVLGSSQTAGAGARNEQESLVWRTEKLLNDRSKGERFEFINVAVRGYHLREMAGDFQTRWVEWNPKTIIINASHNDRPFKEKFEQRLDALVRRARQAGIQVVLINEPNTGERLNPRRLLDMHDIMATIGEKHDVPVIDMQSFLAPQADDGYLWWDWVHMTSLGQRLFAEHLAEELERLGVVDLEGAASEPGR